MKIVENLLRNTPLFFVFLGLINIFVFMGVNMVVGSYFEVEQIKSEKNKIVSKIESEISSVEADVKRIQSTQDTLKLLLEKRVWNDSDIRVLCQELMKRNKDFECPQKIQKGN